MKNICSPLALLIASIAVIVLATSGRAAPNPDRDCFFGQTHVHTSWSLGRLRHRQHSDRAGRML